MVKEGAAEALTSVRVEWSSPEEWASTEKTQCVKNNVKPNNLCQSITFQEYKKH